MTKNKLIATGLILSLLSANLVIGYQYKQDTKEYEEKLTQQSKISDYRQGLIKDKSDTIDVLQQELKKKDSQIKTKDSEIHKLKKALANVKNDSESPSVNVSRGNGIKEKAYFLVTAYTSGYESTGKSPSHPQYGITASGVKVKEGRTIACPRNYPFGTKMKIEGIGYRICEDRGGAIKQGHIDLYIESLTQAIGFGKQTLLVEVLDS